MKQQILKLKKDGKTIRQIAKILGFKSHNSVLYYLKDRDKLDKADLKHILCEITNTIEEETQVGLEDIRNLIKEL